SAPPGAHMPVLRALSEALAVVAPVAVGVYAMRRQRVERFARLLVLAGLALAPNMLALSGHSLPYSIGRTWAWGVVVWLAYLLLAFPAGSLTTKVERFLIRMGLALIATLALPTVLLADFPVPSPWSSCGTNCPANAFEVVDPQPAVIG